MTVRPHITSQTAFETQGTGHFGHTTVELLFRHEFSLDLFSPMTVKSQETYRNPSVLPNLVLLKYNIKHNRLPLAARWG